MFSPEARRESNDNQKSVVLCDEQKYDDMPEILKQIGQIGLVPVVVIENVEDADPLAGALLEGGLPIMEITFRTSAAKGVIARLAKRLPAVLLGAGTVLTVDQAKSAVDAGARYIVSPGLDHAVVEHCLRNKITVIPGAVTPTEIGSALALGISTVKFFPAALAGGTEYLQAVSAPFKNMKFIPTGGINESNLLDYLKLPSVIACGGSWMVKRELIAAKRFEEIRRLSHQAVELISILPGRTVSRKDGIQKGERNA